MNKKKNQAILKTYELYYGQLVGGQSSGMYQVLPGTLVSPPIESRLSCEKKTGHWNFFRSSVFSL